MNAVKPRRKIWEMALLDLYTWMSQRPWLSAIYRRFPSSLRNHVSGQVIAPAHERLRFTRSERWQRANWPPPQVATPTAEAPRLVDGAGVNIHAFARGQFGLAENARLYARALIGSGYPVTICDIDMDIPHGLDDRSVDAWIGETTPYPVDIVFANPDHFAHVMPRVRSRDGPRRYTIACWFWELENFPEEWRPALDDVDEIMVASAFVEQAVRRVTDKPVIRLPIPLSDVVDSGLQRADFGIDDDVFVFLCSFDFISFLTRKNPFAVVEAFRQAFANTGSDVRLLLKSINGHRNPPMLRELLNATSGDARIIVRDEVIDREHVHALQRCCDAYISLHRSEGFGLGLAECMRLGKPVIGTAYSGNMDFMSNDNSCLVPYRLVPVREGEYPYWQGQVWAEPDVREAAVLMRRLYADGNYRRAIGERAAIDIHQNYSPRVSAAMLIDRLEQLGRELSSKSVEVNERQ